MMTMRWMNGLPDLNLPLTGTLHARNFGPARDEGLIDWIVLHTMEAPERAGTALAVATWFAGPEAPQASAHFCVDSLETFQCVPLSQAAWAAPGANTRGVHIEHAGYASQTDPEWADEYSEAVLTRSAALAVQLARTYSVPLVRLFPADLVAGKRGFCGHVDVTNAFDHGKGHTDPGPRFPWDRYLAKIADLASTIA